jgi:membrane protein required for colicin V production
MRVMNLLDVIILIIIGFCLVRGIFRGVIQEISSIIGVVAGFYAAYTYYPRLEPAIKNAIPDAAHLKIVAFLILFCGVFVAVSLLGLLIKKLMKLVFMGWLDRVSGAGFGVLKGILIVSVLLLALTSFLPAQSRLLKHSVLAPHIMKIPETLSRVTPESMQKEFKSNIKEIEAFWKKQSRTLKKQVGNSVPGL